jgi:hypothetical protein
MRKRLWLAALCLVSAGLLWLWAPALIRRMVFTAPGSDHAGETAVTDVSALQARVSEALPSIGLREDQLASLEDLTLQDSRGGWRAVHERWRLPSESDALEIARRLEALVASADPDAEIYVLEQETHEVQIRFYEGTRLAVVLELEPSLGAWPTLPRGRQPQLALVVSDVDADPHAVRMLMERGRPLALALSPYSPFTLRFSRDALLTHTEVLAIAEPDVDISESLEAVPHATGVLVTHALGGDPEQQARALRDADVYLIDASGLGAHWLRALQQAGVPYLRASTVAEPDQDRRRYRHSAVRDGAAVVMVTARGSAASQEADQLDAAAERGYRLAFPAEIIEATRR